MEKEIEQVLNIQHEAWKNGHDNYGSKIDVQAAILHYLRYFKHLNKKQKELESLLSSIDELKYAKKLCSKAQKAVRYIVVKLK